MYRNQDVERDTLVVNIDELLNIYTNNIRLEDNQNNIIVQQKSEGKIKKTTLSMYSATFQPDFEYYLNAAFVGKSVLRLISYAFRTYRNFWNFFFCCSLT